MTKNPKKVVFMFGAGASVAAGVPDTYTFVDEFLNSIGDPDKRATTQKIINTLKEWKGEERIDIELLLETLTKLKNKESEPLLQFYSQKEFVLGQGFEKQPIIDDLKNFIKTKAIVPSGKIAYLQPLLAFIDKEKALDVISLNYDTCIEQLCSVNKRLYQDGFDIHWNPKTFEGSGSDIFLYKLHGSVLWYQSDKGDYIKLPIMTNEHEVQLITGEKAENLMLYPMRKFGYAEPLLELLVKVKHLLEDEACDILVVVGYSFRDEHIVRIILDVARKNKNFHIILVAPDAHEIYHKRLKYYDLNNKIPSSLEGRVSCLPYKFEKVLPSLLNNYVKNTREGMLRESICKQREIMGESTNWIEPILSFANADFSTKIKELLKNTEAKDYERNWKAILRAFVSLYLTSLSTDRQSADKIFKNMEELLLKVFVNGIRVDISAFNPAAKGYNVSVIFNEYPNAMKEEVDSLINFCTIRRSFLLKDEPVGFERLLGKLRKLSQYLAELEAGNVVISKYIPMRSNMLTDLPELNKLYTESMSPDISKMKELIRRIEIAQITPIIMI